MQSSAATTSLFPVPGSPAARQHYRYDAWNRVVEVRADDPENPGQPGDLVATYTYDGSGRRIQKVAAGSPAVTYDYYYNEDGQVLETRLGGDAHPLDQFVWDARYVDAPVVRFHDSNTDGDYLDAGDNVLYYCQDANWNTTALVDAATGEVVERYLYDPYGKVTFLDSDWQLTEVEGHDDGTASAFANEILFAGYGLDAESGLYHTDYREYDCCLGRFIQTDPAGDIDGSNLYQYCRSSPAFYTDPSGLTPNWDKVAQGLFSVCEGATEILMGLPMGGLGTANIPMLGKGLVDYGLGLNKITEGFRGDEGAGAPANLSELIADEVGKATGASTEEVRSRAGALDLALTGMAGAYPRSGTRNLGSNTYKIDYTPLPGAAEARAERIEAALRSHADAAAARLTAQGLTRAQAERIAENRGLEPAFRGERIDTFFKESASKDVLLRDQGAQITPRFRFGPDVRDPVANTWYDVTTPGEWAAHEAKYGPLFGEGVPLFHL